MNTLTSEYLAVGQIKREPYILRWIRRQSVAFSIAFVILVATGAIKWQSQLMPENTYVPMPQAPTPNARDYYDAAEAYLVDQDAVSDALENTPYPVTNQNYGKWQKGHVFTLQDRQKLLRENNVALVKLRQGFQYKYLSPQVRSFSGLMPYFAHDRRMECLLALEGGTYVAESKWGDAVSSYIDAIQLGGDVQKGSATIGTLTGIAINAIGHRHMQDVIRHLNSRQAVAAALRLNTIDASQVTAADALQSEKWLVQGALLTLFSSPRWRQKLLQPIDGPGNSDVPTLTMQCESPRTAYNIYSKYMDSITELSRQPWPQYRDAKWPITPQDPVNKVLLPAFDKIVFEMIQTSAWNRLTSTQLALQAYDADHGSYPSTLDQLTPRYLRSVPVDPFSENQPLRYRKTGPGYVLYSVGPDAHDDGGVAAPNEVSPHGNLWVADQNAMGDIVLCEPSTSE